MLTDGRDALLLPPGDPEALAGAVRRLADDSDLAARLGAGGLETFRARASQRVLGEEWRRLLEGLL